MGLWLWFCRRSREGRASGGVCRGLVFDFVSLGLEWLEMGWVRSYGMVGRRTA